MWKKITEKEQKVINAKILLNIKSSGVKPQIKNVYHTPEILFDALKDMDKKSYKGIVISLLKKQIFEKLTVSVTIGNEYFSPTKSKVKYKFGEFYLNNPQFFKNV